MSEPNQEKWLVNAGMEMYPAKIPLAQFGEQIDPSLGVS